MISLRYRNPGLPTLFSIYFVPLPPPSWIASIINRISLRGKFERPESIQRPDYGAQFGVNESQ